MFKDFLKIKIAVFYEIDLSLRSLRLCASALKKEP